ncbi:MAG: SGNH/GDSL hydrolase family protein [Verrucomicrobia bacterium]|nr:SGNH/GDSL hydrolase family protein [Verrucomicrobiota bacterium]
MKGLVRITGCILFLWLAAFQAQAAFTSLYVFGDTVSTTTNNQNGGSIYYGNRYSNGRVWVELLAQELNLTNNYWYSNSPANRLSYTNLSASSVNWSYAGNDLSYFDHDSGDLVAEMANFAAPPDASNALFIVWVNDADLYDAIYLHDDGTDPAKWSNDIVQSMTNHWAVITNLHAKGVRTLLMPNAVDMSRIPAFDTDAETNFISQECTNYDLAFDAMLNNARVSFPDLKIYEPDYFSLLDNMLANPSAYGVTNALENGRSIDALDDPALSDYSLNGPGSSYIFWDYLDPTARVHAILADMAKQLLAPARVSELAPAGAGYRLDLADVPVGLNGIVLGSTNLAPANWMPATNFISANDTLSVFVPAAGPLHFYRLEFPLAWTWP